MIKKNHSLTQPRFLQPNDFFTQLAIFLELHDLLLVLCEKD